MPDGAEYAGGIWPFVKELCRPSEGESAVFAEHLFDNDWYAVAATEKQASAIEGDHRTWYACGGVVVKSDAVALTDATVRSARVLILSHIGGGVAAPSLPPSAVVEYEPDRFQFLYKLKPFALDKHTARARYKAILQARIALGYADAEECVVEQCFRLPAGLSGEFSPVLRYWDSGPEWELEDLADQLNLNVKVAVRDADPICPKVNLAGVGDAVLNWLRENERIVREGSDGWFAVQCPWSYQHSEEREEAHYSPLGEGEISDQRNFTCFDPACRERKRNVHDLLGWVASQGGPKLRAAELSLDMVDNLTDSDLLKRNRNALIRRALPEVRVAELPDVEVTPTNRSVRSKQLLTRVNLEYLVEKLGLTLKFNVQLRQVEVHFRDARIQNLHLNPQHAIDTVYDVIQRIGIPPSYRRYKTMLLRESFENEYHPMQEWIESKRWDGKSRIAQFLDTVTIAEEEFKEIWPIYCRRWLIQGVQAVCGWREPSQMGQVLVFQGAQGIGKTKWFLALAPAQFTQESISLHMSSITAARDSVSRATRKPLVELGELDNTIQSSKVSSLNAFITATRDIYRPVYAEDEGEWPRATTFFGSVNPRSFLVDQTGSRRFWVLPVKRCKADHGMDMQQVWAEAKELWEKGEKWWLTPDEETIREKLNELFAWRDPLIDQITEYFETHSDEKTEAMNISQFAVKLGVRAKRESYPTIREALEAHIGPARKIRGRKRVWPIPVAKARESYLQIVENAQ